MQFHHHGYVSGDPRVQPAAGRGLHRPAELPDKTDVLIVGSGPAGMLLAAQLAQAAIPIEHWTASTGARVYFVHSPSIPMLDVNIDFDAGSRYDPPGKAGLAESFAGARIVDGYAALLKDAEVDAVYIATPHPGHAEWAIKAAEAGKHVLVEKPIGLTAFEADAMIHAARKAGTFLGEAFMYRLHPQTPKLVELVKSGAIGEVRMIKSSFGFAMPRFMPEHRLYANDLAGGGILDVGGYPVSMARLIAGATERALSAALIIGSWWYRDCAPCCGRSSTAGGDSCSSRS